MRAPPDQRSASDLRAFGVLTIDKPPGPTSHQIVAWIRELLDVDQAAHAGTLDPKVTGCLPVLTGDATRLAQALQRGEKRYVAVLECHEPIPPDIDTVLANFEGDQYQKPPKKSAVRRRLRVREVRQLDVFDRTERQLLLDITCESGTYIRKLCHHIGLAAGIGAHMGELRRIGAGPFDDRSLTTMHELADAMVFANSGEPESLEALLSPAEAAVAHLPSVVIAPSAAESVSEGAPIFAPGVLETSDVDGIDEQLVACYTPDGSVVCLGRLVGDPTADTGLVVSLEAVVA